MGRWILVVIAVATLPIHSFAGELWQGAQSGANPNEVLAIFPDASLLPEPIEYATGDALVLIDNRRVGQYEFDVLFIFGADGLTNVNLKASLKDTAVALGSGDFRELEAALSTKYGAPVKTFPSPPSVGKFAFIESRDYFLEGLSVALSCFQCDNPGSLLIVSYSENLGQLQDGL